MADVTAAQADRYQIAARIERLPFSPWHFKMGAIVSTGWFFDGFDALAIAYVLPVLLSTWHLSFAYIGLMIGAGYAGQLVGSIVFGYLGERYGRVPIFRYTLILYTVMSIACCFAWDYNSLLWMRVIQGLGLGGEIPIMAAYIGEFAKASHRGRYGLGFQLWFSISFIFVSGISYFVVPNWGWQAMFLIGALPAIILIPLRRWMPESPRWLANKGRDEEANAILSKIEDEISQHGAKPLPPVVPVARVQPSTAKISDLLTGIYRRRTLAVWAVWFCTYIIIYGLNTTVPSMLRSIYHASLGQSISFGFFASGLGLLFNLFGILLIDRYGRKPFFAAGQLLGSIPLLILAFYTAPGDSIVFLMALFMLSSAFNGILALGLSTYTAELYPTEMRAVGVGVGNAWVRLAAIVGPIFLGWAIPSIGINHAYLVFAIFGILGGLTVIFFTIETKGKVLEILSPSLRTKGAAEQ
ncbi:MAG TPA: MFS transporter [Stellaceae bacterium]|jgi:putative MFS transporter|nr:MFS transporter [Stellaceae bacterium]